MTANRNRIKKILPVLSITTLVIFSSIHLANPQPSLSQTLFDEAQSARVRNTRQVDRQYSIQVADTMANANGLANNGGSIPWWQYTAFGLLALILFGARS